MGRRGDPWQALRDCLREAARDGFAQVEAPELETRLRAALAACGSASDPEWEGWARELEAFATLGRHDRSVWVAKGLRVCASRVTPTPRPPAAARASAQQRAAAAELDAALPVEEPEEPWPGVETLPGIGPAMAAKLRARGLVTLLDLVYLLPLGYEDRRHRKPLDEVDPGEVAVVEATVGSVRQGFARGRFMATIDLHADDGRGGTRLVQARWFHRVGGLNRWTQGGNVVAVGVLKPWGDKLTMVHPELRDPAEPGPAIAPRYPVVEGVPPRTLAKAVAGALDRVLATANPELDALPKTVADEAGVPSQREAMLALHRPAPELPVEAVRDLQLARSPAHRRLAFDEFFFVQLALLAQRRHAQREPARLRLREDAFDRERLRVCLPFEPTRAQWRVLEELETDMSQGPPMMRLLQGDVGSGKTAVAFGAGLAVARSGGQVALMAPTEILAEQHFQTLTGWCERAGLRLALLTGATAKGARASTLALLEAGQLDVIVGTHALLTQDVRFAALGLVVIDEQHRFGVEQRALLRSKGGAPHLLVMTATPIPRTTALCAYGELEVSVIDELPPGRQPPSTHLLTGARGLAKVREGVAKRVAVGDRTFVVCPLVEASEALDVSDVEATAEALRAAMPGVPIAVVHGRMTSRDKEAVMAAFRSGEARVLVATTVIEVGVDVPDARLMVVEHAERFGLAQLHQLRGRVGRGGGESWCLLHTGAAKGSEAARRLAILTETSDGFEVAERDLQLRGPGEVFGTRQAGAPRLRFAGFAGEGTKLLMAAREAAGRLLARDPDLRAHPGVPAELARRRLAEAVVAADAG